MQRTFREEFYTWSLPGKIPEPRKELDAYLNYYNRGGILNYECRETVLKGSLPYGCVRNG